jgi:biotin operon repressor
MSMCEPAAQTINDLAEALLASRSAITQAVVLLENQGLVQRSRARGERVDRVTARLDASTFERDFDPTGFADTAALLRRGAALLARDDSGRREALEEYAAAARLPCREILAPEAGVARPPREPPRRRLGGGAGDLMLPSLLRRLVAAA